MSALETITGLAGIETCEPGVMGLIIFSAVCIAYLIGYVLGRAE